MNTPKARRIKANILLVCGIIWVTYFAFYKTTALNAYWVSIIGFSWFGPGFISLVKSSTERNKLDDKDD